MSLSVKIEDNATPEIGRVQQVLNPRKIAAIIGPACSRAVRQHFLTLGTNKKGWLSTHFYSRAARATSWQTVSGGIVVSVNQIGVRSRFFGGTIRPVKRKMLAIPIDAESYGKLPGDFSKESLFVFHDKKSGKTFLMRRLEETDGRGKNKATTTRMQALFLLTRSVTQQENRSILPSDDELNDVASEAIIKRLEAVGEPTD